jgi:hypothetical protein
MREGMIALADDVPEPVRAFVAERVEPVFADVGRLLGLPRSADGRGFEAATVPALFSVVGGLSRVFFHTVTGERASFAAVAERYPTGDEPAHAVKDPKLFAEALYLHYQASLVHGLGLSMKRDSRYEPWRLAPVKLAGRELRLSVERLRSLLAGDSLLAGLAVPTGWPGGVGPTLSLTTDALRLEVDALYCGLRRLVRSLSEDPALRAGALAVLEPWYADVLRRDAERAAAILDAPVPARSGSSASSAAGGVTYGAAARSSGR